MSQLVINSHKERDVPSVFVSDEIEMLLPLLLLPLLLPPLLLLLLLLAVNLTVSPAEQSQLMTSQEPIVALAGDDVLLPCHLEPPISASSETVLWTRTDLDPKYIHYHEDGRLAYQSLNLSYKNRTRLFVDQLINGNVSMKLFSVETSDTGTYTCILPSMDKEASVQLSVGDPDVIGSHEPVRVAVGHDAVLPCHLDPALNAATLMVEWERNGLNVHSYRNRNDHLVHQDENFRGRTSLFHNEMTTGDISLKLSNVTELDAGSYSCCLSTLDGAVWLKRGSVSLTVYTEEEGAGTKRIIFITLAYVVVAVAVVAVTFFCVRSRMNHRNTKQKKRLSTSDQERVPGSSTIEPSLKSPNKESNNIKKLTRKLHERGGRAPATEQPPVP